MQILIHIRFLFLFLSFRSLSLSLPLFIYHKAHTNRTHTAHSEINEHSMVYSFHLFAIYRAFIVFIVIVGILQTTTRRRWIEMLCVCFFFYSVFNSSFPFNVKFIISKYTICAWKTTTTIIVLMKWTRKKTKHCATFTAIRLNPSHLCMRMKGSHNCVLQNYVNLQRINYNFF